MTSAAAFEAPLNGFQRTMLLWEEAHPYIAVHAVRVRGVCDTAALREAVLAARLATQLGQVTISADGRFLTVTPPAGPGEIPATACDDADSALLAAIDEEMNRPFSLERHDPLRWRVLQRGDGSYWLLVAYHHVVADARGIEQLLTNVLARLSGSAPAGGLDSAMRAVATGEAAAPRGSGERDAGGPQAMGRTLLAPVAFARAMWLYFRMRYAHKMPDERELDDRTITARRCLTAAQTSRLMAACTRRGVGPNDAYLAALATALAEHTPDRRVSRHRRELVLASVLSTRGAAGASRRVLDVHLADMLMRVRRPDAGIESILSDIAEQSARAKRRRSATAVSALHGFFIRNVWPIFRIPNHRRSYRKLLPISGGVSSFRVSEAAVGPAASQVMGYVRACPPGPAMPLVLAPTLLRDRLELTLVFRPATFSRERGEALLESVIRALDSLVNQGVGQS